MLLNLLDALRFLNQPLQFARLTVKDFRVGSRCFNDTGLRVSHDVKISNLSRGELTGSRCRPETAWPLNRLACSLPEELVERSWRPGDQ